MIGYLIGKFRGFDQDNIVVDVGGVGYSVCVPSRISAGLVSDAKIEIFVHTHLRENALELFGFATPWEKSVFLALTSISGIGPRTATAMLGGLDGETILSSVIREDRATLTSVSGIGKKIAERLITELSDKARKLLAERPGPLGSNAGGSINARGQEANPASATGATGGPAAGATAASKPLPTTQSNLDIADIWNEALNALANLGYREADAIAAIRSASSKTTEAGEPVTLEKLVRSSLQLMSRGL